MNVVESARELRPDFAQELADYEQEAVRFGRLDPDAKGKWVTGLDVDLQAYVTLWQLRKEGERVNDVIRRLAGLGPRQK